MKTNSKIETELIYFALGDRLASMSLEDYLKLTNKSSEQKQEEVKK